MKPTPDDPGAIEGEHEPPMTRSMMAANADDAPGGSPGLLASIFQDATKDPFAEAVPTPPPGPGSHSAGVGRTEVDPDSGRAGPRGAVGGIGPGVTFYSKYRVLRKLGGGAMGDVWLVRHAMLKSEHALKVIVPNFATNPLALMRFQREFEVMATLRHEHAVTIYDASIDAGGGYIDMEYVEGRTIHEALGMARARDGRDPSAPLMPLDWVARILEQLCEVLEVAHRKGIVHRDLKPSNLMLLGGRPAGKEYLKVLDFGIAKIRDDPEAAGREPDSDEHKTQGYIGTPSYGSPEQALGVAEIDGRADLYSVGILLYEFVTGRLPFRGNHWQVMSQNANSPPPPFAEANPRLRPMPALERAIFRALSKRPDDRPQSARDLCEEIRRAIEATPSDGGDGPSPAGTLPATCPDGADLEPPSTQADTLVARARQGEKPPGPDEAEAGQPTPTPAEGTAPPRSTAARTALATVAIVVALVGTLAVLHAIRGRTPRDLPEVEGPPVAGGPTPPGAGASPARKTPVDFEQCWPPGYRPLEGSARGQPWPEKVRRTADEAVFVRFAEGVYLPESFEPDSSAGLAADGWPRVIVKAGARFVRMPGGTWIMGAWDDPNAVDRADAPAHPVTLTGFYLQETEATHGQVEALLLQADDAFPTDWAKTFHLLKQKVGPDEARRYPASNVSRLLALRLGRELGGQLPTEAQWEYAARSLGQRRRHVWGDDPPPDRNLARVDALDATPAPVGSYPRAPGEPGRDRTEQGVLDLAGNVQEMCRDAWVSSYVKDSAAAVDPCQPAVDPARDPFAIRGGYYGSIGKDCATTRRDDRMTASEVAENVGFRLVVECPAPRKPR